jgi:flagellar M-ring protein FliF
MASVGRHAGTMINAAAFIVVVFLVAFFGLRPMAGALRPQQPEAIAGPSFEEVQRSLPVPEGEQAAQAASAGALPGARAQNPLDDLRQKIRPAPQERLARMVDLNEERTAQILRKWAGQEVVG